MKVMIPEHQAGLGGQMPYFHDNPEPGEIRNMTYSAVASGDFDSANAHSTYPLGLPDPGGMGGIAHKMLYKSGYAVGCVHPEDNLSGLKLYIITNWELFDPKWVPNLEKFVEACGTLVISARTATRDINNNVVPETLPGCLREFAGICKDRKSQAGLDIAPERS